MLGIVAFVIAVESRGKLSLQSGHFVRRRLLHQRTQLVQRVLETPAFGQERNARVTLIKSSHRLHLAQVAQLDCRRFRLSAGRHFKIKIVKDGGSFGLVSRRQIGPRQRDLDIGLYRLAMLFQKRCRAVWSTGRHQCIGIEQRHIV